MNQPPRTYVMEVGDPRGLNSRVQCEGLTQERWDATQRMLQQRKNQQGNALWEYRERQRAQAAAAAAEKAQAAAAQPQTLAEWERLLTSTPAPYPMASRVYTPLPERGTFDIDADLRRIQAALPKPPPRPLTQQERAFKRDLEFRQFINVRNDFTDEDIDAWHAEYDRKMRDGER